MRALGADARARVRQQPRHRRPVAIRVDGRQRADAAARAAGRRVVRAADRVRQRRQSAARVRTRAAPRAARSASRSARSRRDLARQLTLESVVLALAGGALGVAPRRLDRPHASSRSPARSCRARRRLPSTARVLRSLPPSRPRPASSAASGRWLACAGGELARAVREGDVRTGSASGRRFGNALVVAEIAWRSALLVGAGLLVKNLVLLRNRDAGISDRDASSPSTSRRPAALQGRPMQQVAVLPRGSAERLAHTRRRDASAMTSHLPMYQLRLERRVPDRGRQRRGGPTTRRSSRYRWIDGDYLKTMGIRLLVRDGRSTTAIARARRVAIISANAMAKKFWPGKDPIGKRFGQGSGSVKWYEVVGVLQRRALGRASRNAPYEFYRPHRAGVGLRRR